MSKEDKKLALRSEDVQEILSYIPHWIIRWGISLILIILLLLLAASWIIKYPDVITSRITITTQNPPVRVIARSSGKIVQLAVKEKQEVKKNDFLAAIENPASIEDAFRLKKLLVSYQHILSTSDRFYPLVIDTTLLLGELQSDYSNFLQKYRAYEFFHTTNYYESKIASIHEQLIHYESLNQKLTSQIDLLQKEVQIANKKYVTDSILFAQKAITVFEQDNSESAYLQKKYSLKNAEVTVLNNNIQQQEYQKNIMDLTKQYNEQKRDFIIGVQEAYKKLQSQLDIWWQQYILEAPIDGSVSFFKYWSNNQFVNTGEEIMTIIPTASTQIIGKIFLPGMGAGKVKAGQKVIIKLDNYPHAEFGMVEGKIESVSEITRENMYLINVSLPAGLTSSYHKSLQFRQEMQGTADIVTEDKRLLEKIFYQLRSLIDRATS